MKARPKVSSAPLILEVYVLNLFQGTLTKIAGVECYVATPTGDFDKTKVVIYLCDAFGIELDNNQVRTTLQVLYATVANVVLHSCSLTTSRTGGTSRPYQKA